MLADCQITPYVVFEGGVAVDKLMNKPKKVCDRLKKIIEFSTDFSSKNSEFYFPLFMRSVFENVLKKSKIKTVRCDFKSFGSTLSMAKNLNCPVLSYDSKYFLCSEIMYIPFQSLRKSDEKPYPSVVRRIIRGKPEVRYIPCGVFDVNGFLQHLGLTSDTLPLVGVMLGSTNSDYPNCATLWPEIRYINKRLLKIASWIQDLGIESATNNLLDLAETTSAKMKLQQKIESFKFHKCKYLPYLEIRSVHELPKYDVDEENDRRIDEIPDIFLENFRKCRYSPYLMDIYTHKTYFGLKPQLENINRVHSHILSEVFVNAIHKILTKFCSNLKCFVREGESMVEKVLPSYDIDVPFLKEIEEIIIEDRRLLMLTILGVNFIKDDVLEFPETYQLLITTIIYLQKHSSLTWPLVYSLVMCVTILSYVDDNNERLFHCNDKSLNYDSNLKPKSSHSVMQISILQEVEHFRKYFEIREGETILFDVDLMHDMSQFQSCLLHIHLLNDVLNMPFSDYLIAECLNSTFIYNFTKKLEERTPNMEDFVRVFLRQKAPNVMVKFLEIMDKIVKTSQILNH
nr:protein asteroid homolog 1-like [Leptinotarsa decemlineata]